MKKHWLMILALISANTFALESGIQGHNAGEVVSVKTDSQVAAWCNFDKQVVVTANNVLCVYNGSKKSAD